ncbi:PREDICTED: uncharacterized protein LOC107194233 [Dufourea novaeangliae]|uniref:uncharacterized protein LOC107194233 n=1 Tax=Dufourea novaeangliae TaxID=178035 RepID=UPI000767C009|nr:PREDICTED: uncharacterized protein LOC107194233 [Dufourea novaeangliae]
MYSSKSRSGCKRHKEEKIMIIKPYDFCCSSDNIDPLTQYDQKENFFNKSSLMSMNTINESPVLKFRTHFTGYVDSELTKKSAKAKPSDIEDSRRKLYTKQPVNKLSKYTSSKLHIRAGSSDDDLCDKQTNKVKEGPIQWYLEDEIRFAKDIFWEKKRKAYNEEMNKNIEIGMENVRLYMKKESSKCPRWYQDFSIDQMKNLMMLQCVIQQDCEEMVTGRTQRTLAEIGAISTFFMLTPDIIKKLQEICNCNAIEFLREIYKILTGSYFEEEGYKQFYDCNERIILSAIAFLTLPEAIVELHERLPSVIMPKIIPKPVPPTSPIRQKKESPYEEDLFLRPDWVSYYNKYEIWQAKCQLIPIPKVILPPKECLNLKNMLTSPDIYPYDVKPVNLPEEPKTRCAREYEDISIVDDSIKLDEVSRTQLLNKGPCGWRTKSEQQLPTKKTLVYLSEPDYPPETIAVRPGGRPCICRQNKDKKKVLTYNIGGLIRGKRDDPDVIDKKLLKKKKDQDDKKLQVIEGIIYHTPPPSPRRSDEYVPEYDLYTSPYDMCLSQRTDKNLKYFEQYSGPKGSMPKGTKQREPCECDEFVDTYGIQVDSQDTETEKATAEFEKNRQQLIEAIPPKERWDLALKDIGLIDYYTRCKDSMPCWLKCAKFNNVGCKLPIRKLQIKRPVCECKYERKILEHKEEKTKWKERRKRLKSMKKEPFMNIVDTSKPMVADTKLMISGVKRIPREDEYVDDVKYCITGVVENYTEEPPKPIVGGVQMATPIQTPEPSVEEIPCVCLHRHWSPTNIPPGPVPKPEEIRQAEEKKRRQAAEEAYKQIHAPEPVYDSHGTHSCKKTCDPNALSEDEDTEGRDSIMPRLSLKESRSRATGLPKQTKHQRKSITDDSKIKENNKRSKTQGNSVTKIISPQKKVGNVRNDENLLKGSHAPREAQQKDIVEKKSQSLQRTQYKGGESDPHLQNINAETKAEVPEASDAEEEEVEIAADFELIIVVRNELMKMAAQGFLFAKLPKCFLLPQLRYWLMYREGFALTDADKEKSLQRSLMMWNSLSAKKLSKLEPPSLNMTKFQLRNLTFSDIERMKEKIARNKAIFHSEVRKNRVVFARSLWNTMDYGKFPSLSFKRAFFSYMAGKEADGYVFKPWFRSDVRKGTT